MWRGCVGRVWGGGGGTCLKCLNGTTPLYANAQVPIHNVAIKTAIIIFNKVELCNAVPSGYIGLSSVGLSCHEVSI